MSIEVVVAMVGIFGGMFGTILFIVWRAAVRITRIEERLNYITDNCTVSKAQRSGHSQSIADHEKRITHLEIVTES